MWIDKVLSQLPVISCAVTGIVLLTRLHSSVRLLAVHAVLAAVTEFLARGMAPGNNHIVYTIFLPIDFFLIIFAARDYLRGLFLPFAIPSLLTFLGVYSYILVKTGTEFLPFEAIVTSWILQAVCWFLALQHSIRQTPAVNVKAICLITGGILLFTCTTAPVWAMFRYNMLHDPVLARSLQNICNVTSMIRYVATGIGLILLADKQVPIVRHAVR